MYFLPTDILHGRRPVCIPNLHTNNQNHRDFGNEVARESCIEERMRNSYLDIYMKRSIVDAYANSDGIVLDDS